MLCGAGTRGCGMARPVARCCRPSAVRGDLGAVLPAGRPGHRHGGMSPLRPLRSRSARRCQGHGWLPQHPRGPTRLFLPPNRPQIHEAAGCAGWPRAWLYLCTDLTQPQRNEWGCGQSSSLPCEPPAPRHKGSRLGLGVLPHSHPYLGTEPWQGCSLWLWGGWLLLPDPSVPPWAIPCLWK